MTLNATLYTLVEKQRLKLWQPLNAATPHRYLFLTTIINQWIENLDTYAKVGRLSKNLTPREQVDGFFDQYGRGSSLQTLEEVGMKPPFKRLNANGNYRLKVWEIRLTHVRLFGWFVRAGVFVAVVGKLSSEVHGIADTDPGSAGHQARSVARWRTQAGFMSHDIYAGNQLDALLETPVPSPFRPSAAKRKKES
ncbi:MAG: hypothetical protein ABF946_10030 [Acetobacter papayae]